MACRLDMPRSNRRSGNWVEVLLHVGHRYLWLVAGSAFVVVLAASICIIPPQYIVSASHSRINYRLPKQHAEIKATQGC